MEKLLEDPAQEMKRLQRCINDLISVLALPATWIGSEPPPIVHSLLDGLLNTLNLDFIYVRLVGSTGEAPEFLRASSTWEVMPELKEVGEMVRSWLGDGAQSWPQLTRKIFKQRDISMLPMQLGLHGEIGVLIAGSERIDFPQLTERLLLSVAANQATIGLQEARLRSEQQRIASELERRVAERSMELATINERLRKEIADRNLKEEKLRLNKEELRVAHMQMTRSEERWRSVFQNSAIGVALTDPDGWFIATNPAYQKMLGYTQEELQQLRFLDITIKEDRDQNWMLIEELFGGKCQQFQIEKQYRRKDGSGVWVRNSVSLVPGTERVPRFIMALSEDITERKRAEEAIRTSEVKLRQVIDAIPTLAWCNLPDGSNEFLNRGWHEYTGLSPEESHGWGWQAAFHPDDLPPLMEKWEKMLVSGESDEIEARLRRHDGVYRWFLIRAQAFRDESGNIVRWYGTSTDIEDRKRAEEALREGERDLAAIINTIPTAAWTTRQDGYCEFLNQGWLDYAGMAAEQAQGWGWTEAIHPDDRKRLVEEWQSCLASGIPVDTEARIRRFDSSYRWFLIRGNPLRDESGNILKWYGTCTDIQDRKRGEEALRDREQSLRLVIDGIAGLVAIMSATGEVEAVNRQVSDYFGRSVEEMKAWSTSDAVHTDDLPDVISAWIHSIETASPYDVDHRLRRADGVYRWFHARGLPLRDLEGRVLRWYVLLTDIDDRKRAEEELRNAQSELARVMRVMTMGQLTASIAHEVNQPISGIITNASTCLRMLDTSPPNLEGARETARRTIRDGHRASDVITRLRTLYSKKEPALEQMDLNEAAREVTALSSTEMQKNGVTLRQEFADDLPPAVGDRLQLQQVILNLLRNAADAMSTIDDRPREILIRTERDEGHQVRLSVKDSGVGFTPQVAGKIFEAFYTTKPDGMGIGLSVSRSIIEAHQGRLWATPNDGPGSTFSFAIPRAIQASTDAEIRLNRTDPSTDAA